jgi:hypothetical protein
MQGPQHMPTHEFALRQDLNLTFVLFFQTADALSVSIKGYLALWY